MGSSGGGGGGGYGAILDLVVGVFRNQYEARQNAYAAQVGQDLAKYASEDAVERGREQVGDIYRERNRLVESSAPSAAAQNLGLASGSPVDVRADIASQSEIDATRARNNAAREAWGYNQQRRLLKYQEKQYKDQGRYLGLKGLWKMGSIKGA